MTGKNPYLSEPEKSSSSHKFCITYLPENKTIEIDSSSPSITQSGIGLPGSILDIALASGIDIDHACGGVCACATCHIIIEKGMESCSPSTEAEEDQLDKAPGLTPYSRLACQCVPNGNSDLVVKIPKWNRNLVRE